MNQDKAKTIADFLVRCAPEIPDHKVFSVGGQFFILPSRIVEEIEQCGKEGIRSLDEVRMRLGDVVTRLWMLPSRADVDDVLAAIEASTQ